MIATQAPPMTLEQFLELPETEPASEFVCGEVIQKPMPDAPHSFLQGFLWMFVTQYLITNRIGRIGPEWRCTFGPPGATRAYVPDVTYVSLERYPHRDVRRHRQLRVAPDLAIEILSPGQNTREFVDKIVFYLMNGVRLVWVVDPDAETVLVLKPNAQPVTLTRADVLDGADVLPGLLISLAELFDEALS